ncbi:hypothetical protein SSX86_010408 [Deinandra increscens subsp. villosa]|uniref:Integrase catalytic domain-containing protein n=1 Tax=Deinandra increscens subsp. villosa TaxID=3103831 RepID=A0AAP0DBR3_9ASTR
MSSSSSLHPALTVTNIKHVVPLVLEQNSAKYLQWVQLFKTHCKACNCLQHLTETEPSTPPPPAGDAGDAAKAAPAVDRATWDRVDATVLSWIYATIHPNLFSLVMKEDTHAATAWKALKDVFGDNENARALELEHRFVSIKLDNFADISAYCQELKEISDQLANVNAPVSEQRMVLQLISGLNDSYDGVAMLIQQSNPLPDFNEARSRLLLEETRKNRNNNNSSTPPTALQAAAAHHPNPPPSHPPVNAPPPSGRSYGRGFYDQGRGSFDSSRSRGRGYRGKGRGRPRGRGFYPSGSSGYTQPHYPPWQTPAPSYNPAWQQQPPPPPCPYPTMPATQPTYQHTTTRQPNLSAGILGPAPPQAYYGGYTPPYPPPHPEYAAPTPTMTADPNWYMDSGATHHMTHHAGNLSSYVNNSRSNYIVVGDGTKIPIYATGHSSLSPPFPPLHLKNIFYSPNILKNLLSVRRLTADNKIILAFDEFGFSVKDYQTQRHILRCDSPGPLYSIPSSLASSTSPSTFVAVSEDLWHSRLGHPGATILRLLNSSNKIRVNKFSNKPLCSSCVMGKHIKLPFYESLSVTNAPFDIVHSDVWTSPVTSTGGHKYYVLFLDNYTNHLWTFPLAHKSSVFTVFLQFHNLIANQFSKKIKFLQCDNGTEYNNKHFHEFFRNNGIQFRFSCPHTSSQNRKSERKIRSINNIVRTLLAHSSVPPTFWHHALQMATYLINILPSKTLNFLTPTHLLYHQAPSYHLLRTFGCLCYPLYPSSTINKLNPRSTPCAFLGYPTDHRGYKCFDIATRNLIISRHVLFDEANFPFSKIAPNPPTYNFLDSPLHPLLRPISVTHTDTPPNPAHPPNSPTTPGPNGPLAPPTPPSSPPTHNSPPPSPPSAQNTSPDAPPTNSAEPTSLAQPTSPEPVSPSSPDTSASPVESSSTSIPIPPPPPARTMHTRSMSGISKPKHIFNLNASIPFEPLPKNPSIALTSPIWYQAMHDEFTALIDNKTWDLVPPTPDMNVVRCLWLFKHKLKSDGSLERYKARLVCDGRSQQVGIDCHETFSPVVKPATIRTILSLALANGWDIRQLDVKNAFLHGHLAETVFMTQPMGFRDPYYPNHVCRLKKSLYGLKQAPRAWYQRFTDLVASIGFRHSVCDHSLFIYRHGPDVAYILSMLMIFC